METLLSKKFILVIIFAVLGFVFVLLDKTSSEFYFKFMELIAGGYLIGNGVDKVNDTITDIQDIKTNPIK